MGRLAEIELFLLDMDGTFYLGNRLLPGAKEFLQACNQKGVRYCFLTNNSSKSSEDYIKRLAEMGVEVSEQQMYTSGDASLQYIKEQGWPEDILLVGTNSLRIQFEKAGWRTRAERPQAVLLGFDTDISYDTLCKLCDAVRSGVPYVATHPDNNCPVPGGMIPDVGAVIAFVHAATGRLPDVVVGKPNKDIARLVAQKAGLPLEKICMVGDRLYTDIALGKAGVHTALVFCGEATRDELAHSEIQPDYVFENLGEMIKEL